MPRQPYLPGFSHIHYNIGAVTLKERPDFCAGIGKCIGIWTYVDNEMGNLFAILLGTNSDAALQVFLSLRRSSNQREALQLAAKYALSEPVLTAFEALLVVYKSLESQRNDLAHGCFGLAPSDPDILFWIDVKHHVHFQTEALTNFSLGNPIGHERLKENLFVYRMADINQLYEKMEEFWWAAFYFAGYLRQPGNLRRAAEFQQLCAYPQIQQEISRLNAGRGNTPSTPP